MYNLCQMTRSVSFVACKVWPSENGPRGVDPKALSATLYIFTQISGLFACMMKDHPTTIGQVILA